MNTIQTAEFQVIHDESGELLASCEGPMPQVLDEALRYVNNYSEEGDEVTLEVVVRTPFTKAQVEELNLARSQGIDVFFDEGVA